MRRVKMLCARDTAAVNPCARLALHTHGARTERAMVLLHGFTNNPYQFRLLAPLFFAQGYNVLVPRAPYHGMADRLTPALGLLTPADLRAYAGEAIDIAQGLGERVSVLGLSMGATLAAWAAQHRADVDTVVVLAPNFGFDAVPQRLLPLVVWLGLLLPNFHRWWNEELKDQVPGPQHAYPRFASRGLAAIFKIGLHVFADAASAPPRARAVWVVTNGADIAVSNIATAEVVRRWRAAGAANVFTFEFPAALALLHDLIDPDQVTARTEAVYPTLLEIVEGRRPPDS